MRCRCACYRAERLTVPCPFELVDFADKGFFLEPKQMQNSSRFDSQFVQRRLAWFLAAAGLIFYLCTLVPWISLRGFATLAKASGWDWHPVYIAPLHYLVTY